MSEQDHEIREILERVRSIAVVGFSMNPARPSHGVARYLAAAGYRVLPVNPGHAGEEAFGTTVCASLAELPEAPDMVDIFRRSEAVGPVVDEALALFPDLDVIWMQLGIRNPEAAARAEARGVTVVQDRCPKIDHARLIAPRG